MDLPPPDAISPENLQEVDPALRAAALKTIRETNQRPLTQEEKRFLRSFEKRLAKVSRNYVKINPIRPPKVPGATHQQGVGFTKKNKETGKAARRRSSQSRKKNRK